MTTLRLTADELERRRDDTEDVAGALAEAQRALELVTDRPRAFTLEDAARRLRATADVQAAADLAYEVEQLIDLIDRAAAKARDLARNEAAGLFEFYDEEASR